MPTPSNDQLRTSALRIGAVRYLNTKPLVHGLKGATDDLQLCYDLPSRLADRLAAGELDVALIPSIEVFHNPQYTIVSDACIACRGPVWSVKLFSRVPLANIRTLALDEGSRTSVAMVQILLRERYGVGPELRALPIGDSAADSDADAVLLIGDRAIHPPPERFAEVWDLGDQWRQWARLPFVFAMWAARPGVDVSDVGEKLARARDDGLANLEHIAEREAAAVGLTADECLRYLRDNLHFSLGEQERKGLELFQQQAAGMGLAPAEMPLNYDDCLTSP